MPRQETEMVLLYVDMGETPDQIVRRLNEYHIAEYLVQIVPAGQPDRYGVLFRMTKQELGWLQSVCSAPMET